MLSFFKAVGFTYIPTNGKQRKFGGIPGEIDAAYILQNLVVIVEETIGESNDHLRTKIDYFEKIKENKTEFLKWLAEIAPDKMQFPPEYSIARYQIVYCYASETALSEDVSERYPQIKYFKPKVLKYFLHLAKSIRYSARNEFYKFLGLSQLDIGEDSSSTQPRYINSAVIIPEAGTGFPSGMHIVSFVMKAQELLDCAYVFRKESWESRMGQYYQRLVDKSKVDKIRHYLATSKMTFIDNIVVTLPEGTTFNQIDKNGKDIEVDVDGIGKISSVQIRIPYEINSIGIIDGQHRVFGHYHGIDILEAEIDKHRQKRHLFVTGIFYSPGKFKESDKRIFESGLFLLMNNNHNRVKTDLLQYIETLKSPQSPLGIASNVLINMNNRDPFKDTFLLSPLDKVGIKTPTIVKYGLQGLVEISNEKETIFKYWDYKDKANLLTDSYSEEIYWEYVRFCSVSLSQYFNAVKAHYKDSWNISNKNERLLTSTAIVGFLKSFGTSLSIYKRVNDFNFYKEKFANLSISFFKEDFGQYGSSHWPKLALKIDKEAWGVNLS